MAHRSSMYRTCSGSSLYSILTRKECRLLQRCISRPLWWSFVVDCGYLIEGRRYAAISRRSSYRTDRRQRRWSKGPIKKDKTSFLVSARRSHADLLMNDLFVNSSPDDEIKAYVYFYDANLKSESYLLSERSIISQQLYWAGQTVYTQTGRKRECRKIMVITVTAAPIHCGALYWYHTLEIPVFNPKLFANATANYSQYYFSTDYKYSYKPVNTTDTGTLSGKYYSRIQNAVGKVDFEFRPEPRHTIKFGGGAITHSSIPAYHYSKIKERDNPLSILLMIMLRPSVRKSTCTRKMSGKHCARSG